MGMRKVFRVNGSAVTAEIFPNFAVYVIGIAGQMEKINLLIAGFMKGIMSEYQPNLIFCRWTNRRAVEFLSGIDGWKFVEKPAIPDDPRFSNEPIFAIQPKVLR